MELVKPDIGLLFWMTTCFILLLLIMKKFAWGPILRALNEREEGIQSALDQAEEARKEVSETSVKVEQMLKEGKIEREEMLKVAREEIAAYKKEEQMKIKEQTHNQLNVATAKINQQKRAAVDELKKSVAELSVEIAEKILKKELEAEENHVELINNSIKNLEIK